MRFKLTGDWLWKKIKNFKNKKFAQTPNSTFNMNKIFNGWFNGTKDEILESNETIFSIITRLSNTLASLPLKELKDYKEIHDDTSQLVTISPNPNISAFEFINKLETDRNVSGNGYALIIRDDYEQPEALLPLPYTSVQPMIAIEDNSLWYRLIIYEQNIYINPTDIIHVKHITGASRYEGISPLDVLRNSLKFDEAVQKFSLREMDKIDAFKVNYGSNIDEDKRNTVIESIKAFIQENGGVLFSEPGVEVTKIDRDFQSTDLANTESITNRRIANAFNVPIQFINEANGANGFSSNEQLMTQFVQMTLTPIVRQYEQEFNRKLLTDSDRQEGRYFKFNMNGLLRGDVSARTQFYQQMRRSGVFTTNDILKLEDMPISNDKNANRLFISGDMYPMDMDPLQRKGVNSNDNQKNKSTQVLDDEIKR
ncbi:phage portal protein [Bombilactobacillus bombi]|uniref:Phage portal protein n=1 Tax=Bombilactobacillus bombi TaxID=1303590 RepID=A0A417Z654_9LACO|nr:phage portal protein [Bombilactobacillus bombi]RHW46088.1 phage portal protein [Bombilactobacillus bombi]